LWAVFAVLFVLLTSCDSADSRTTAQVEAIQNHEACLVAEDPGQGELTGCYPIDDRDAAKIKVGDCIDVRIPYDSPQRPLYDVELLDRECHLGRAAGRTREDLLSLVGFVLVLAGASAAVILTVRWNDRRQRSAPPG
jgi:hypothetical protein